MRKYALVIAVMLMMPFALAAQTTPAAPPMPPMSGGTAPPPLITGLPPGVNLSEPPPAVGYSSVSSGVPFNGIKGKPVEPRSPEQIEDLKRYSVLKNIQSRCDATFADMSQRNGCACLATESMKVMTNDQVNTYDANLTKAIGAPAVKNLMKKCKLTLPK